MAHYVISDLHGDIDRFHRMLDTIAFSAGDTLYILGDIVDRGPAPIPLLREVMRTPNMVMLLGNHEHMCIRYYSPDATPREIRHWDINNNIPTKMGLAALTEQELTEVFQFLMELPIHLEVTVNGRDFYLVHGFPGETLRDEVWGRPAPDAPNPLPGKQVIVGHTPVCCLGRDEFEEERYNRELAARGERMRIFHGEGYLDLDCGCGYDIPTSALSCLRLEDMAEFYV